MPAVTDTPDPARAAQLAFIVETVRAASREGRVVPEDEAVSGVADTDPAGHLERAGIDADDIKAVGEGVPRYLYSERHMTRRYAEALARAADGDPVRLIAGTVRDDSATYPRPTPVAAFTQPPFGLDCHQVGAALSVMQDDPACADIQSVTASDGSLFLFSTASVTREHAASLAEWLAVGRFENP